ncbi:membrane-bound O-acyltransferase gup1 [Impatiens glandulifera]|uniref:membrane-bound O-acyltransferase gup1 n=1 Tax=Impatiens glandulifera TaxID=253017 RepID=UPI001FB06E49|nr:membrane-bound O-acyltransferase gup1 [Impatiens glandulifera]
MGQTSWRRRELVFLILYAVAFYAFIIHRSLKLSSDHFRNLRGLGSGWIGGRLNDVSDAQWRNTRGNLSILTFVFGIFTLVANVLRASYHLQARGMSIVWLLISLAYIYYLHGACTIFIILIASTNFLLVKTFGRTKYFLVLVWIFNLFFLIYNRLSEGYRFSSFGNNWAFLDNHRGAFRWHICFNFVTLRMISFAHDYHWAHSSRFDQKKHVQTCAICSSGKTCYLLLQERSVQNDKFSFGIYLCYLLFAPLYIAGPIISFNAFVSQLDSPQRNYSLREVAWYGVRWFFCLFLMELMTHFFYYNAFVISGSWKQLSPTDIFIIGYGVLNFMWLKFLLIWRFFRFWGLINGIDAPENMPRCINNCHNLESFWKSWHASFNKWLVRYMYIPLGGSGRKLLNVWVIFTFVAIWHDLEWKLLSWAWLTCVFFVPEMIVKSAVNTFQVRTAFWTFVSRELSAISGAITITCLMVANLVGYVIGPSGINWLVSRFLQREGISTLAGMFATFYVGTKVSSRNISLSLDACEAYLAKIVNSHHLLAANVPYS